MKKQSAQASSEPVAWLNRIYNHTILVYAGLCGVAWLTFILLRAGPGYSKTSVYTLLVAIILDVRLLLFPLERIKKHSLKVYKAGIFLIVPAVLGLFAELDWVLSMAQAHSFNIALTKIDALYFAVSTTTTTGFGDIHPVTQFARLIVSVQMVLSFLITALVIVKAIDALNKRGHQS